MDTKSFNTMVDEATLDILGTFITKGGAAAKNCIWTWLSTAVNRGYRQEVDAQERKQKKKVRVVGHQTIMTEK